jgi:hypothetical protein
VAIAIMDIDRTSRGGFMRFLLPGFWQTSYRVRSAY